MGKAIGEQLGEVVDAAVYELPDKARFVKIKILFDVTTLIRAGMFIGNKVDSINWIDFRFENLSMFCFHCGLVGHIEENYPEKQETNEDLGMESVNARGAWLRSNNYGRRIIEKKEKTFRSNPRNSLSCGQFSPIPKGLIDQMATLNMQQDSQMNETQDQYSNEKGYQQKSGSEIGVSMQKKLY
jgi:hypothetical protein